MENLQNRIESCYMNTTNRVSRRKSINSAIKSAKKLRSEIPKIVQPEKRDYDFILLADEVIRLRKILSDLPEWFNENIGACVPDTSGCTCHVIASEHIKDILNG